MSEVDDAWDAEPEPATKPAKQYPKGKNGRANLSINWPLAEKLYVEGELVGEAEHTKRVYPRIADIARRAGTSLSNLNQHSWRYNWTEKRLTFQRDNAIVPAYAVGGQALADAAIPRRLARRDPEGILVAYIELFAEAVEKRSVRFDTIADLDKAIRLLAFVRGQADSTKHVHVSVTLEAMQKRHRELRAHVQNVVDDDVAGVLGAGSPLGDALGPADDDEGEGEAWDADPNEGAQAAE